MKSPLRRAALRDYRSCFRSFGLILAAAYIASTTVHAASLFNPRNSNLADVQSLQSSPDGAVFRVSLSPTLHQGQGGTLDSDFDGNCYTGGFLWAVPNGIEEVDVQISDPHWRTVGRNEISDSLWNYVLSNPLPLADVSNIMVMRGMSFVVFAFNALQITESNDGLRLCEQADIELRYRGTAYPADTRILSASFYNLARGVCSNLDEVIPAPQPVPESYLIIANPAYTTTALSEFTHWKRAQGHSVTVVTTEQTGTTNQLIKAYIQNAYNTWPEPPVFVLLVGDVDNPHPLPTWSVAGYYHPLIASDHPYTLLEGTDYLPEVFIGRFSVDNTTELQTVVNKCINYERTPYEPSGEWRRSMLITGVRSTPTQFITYNSAWPTLEWIGRQFLEAADYTNVYAVPNPPGSASQISQYINSGVSFIAYRGYGSPSGWAYPAYELSQISALSNGSKLPFIASIVCGGGAFESTVDPCFGELWLRAGTPLNPKGAIGFIGPSEIDTKTRWNNTNIAGIFQGILFENVQTQAAAMLRGKLELFHEFPNNVNITEADADRSVQFYFNCYNLMGDPGLAFFVGNARHLTATIPSTLPWGTPSVTISVTENGIPLPEVWGTVMRNQEVISRAAGDQQGIITLDLPQTAGGEVTITLTKPRHETLQSTVNLGTQANAVGASLTVMRDDESHGASGNGDGLVNPGERLALGVVLHNYGTNGFNGGILSVSAVNSDLTPISSQLSIPTLAVGANSDTLWFPVDVTHSSMDGAIGRLEWTVNPGSWTWQTTHEVYAPSLVVSNVMTNGGEGNPPPLSTSNIAFQLTNQGRATISPFTAQLHSEHQQLIVNDSLADYPAIAPGMSAYPSDDDFNITSGSYYPGDWAPISINIENLQVQSICSANLPVGNLTEDDPSHPDDYGYRVFQSNDTAYQESPAYAWMEIDPTQGGAGTILSLPDYDNGRDTTVTVGLPFTFRFYGVPYNQVSICSNGFVALGQTSESYFRNYSLPAIASPDQMICVFWDDLYIPTTGHVSTYYDVDGGRFIIEWNGLINQYSTGQEETFQLVLYDTSCWATRTGDGDILMQYKVFNNTDTWDNYATVGIQDRDQSFALPITYAGAYEPGISMIRSLQSLLITTGRPEGTAYFSYAGSVIDDDNSGGSSGNGDGVAQNGETLQMQLRLTNTGSVTSPAVNGICRSLDPLAVLLDSALSFNPISPGATEVSNAVRVRLSGQIANRHVVNFQMALGGDATPCVLLPSLQIGAPLLSLLPLDFNDDGIPPSSGNGNGEMNPGETIELIPWAVNSGRNTAFGVNATLSCSDSRITVLNSLSRIGIVEPDSTADGLTPFVIRVSSSAGSGSRITFNITLTDTFGNQAVSSLIYTIVRPYLEASGIRVNDPPPGGDGNLHLSLGETGELFPQVLNSGLGAATNVTILISTFDTLVTLADSIVDIGMISPNAVRESVEPIRITINETGPMPRVVQLSMRITADDGIFNSDAAFLTIGDVNFFEDFETDRNYWSVFGSPNSWQLQTRHSHSSSHAYYCGDSQNQQYLPGASIYLRSPLFDFPGRGALSFWSRYNLADANDRCIIEFQTGPTEYHILGEFTGTSDDWVEHYYSLEGIPAVESARIRFRFESNFTGQAEGWYVDDVVILEEDLAIPPAWSAIPPEEFALEAGFPNPFNDRTTIQYRIPRSGPVQVSLFNIQGKRIATLVNENKEPGEYRLSWQPIGLASGIYLVHLEAGKIRLTGKLVYIK